MRALSFLCLVLLAVSSAVGSAVTLSSCGGKGDLPPTEGSVPDDVEDDAVDDDDDGARDPLPTGPSSLHFTSLPGKAACTWTTTVSDVGEVTLENFQDIGPDPFPTGVQVSFGSLSASTTDIEPRPMMGWKAPKFSGPLRGETLDADGEWTIRLTFAEDEDCSGYDGNPRLTLVFSK